jgi:predicted Zn-dependent protease
MISALLASYAMRTAALPVNVPRDMVSEILIAQSLQAQKPTGKAVVPQLTPDEQAEADHKKDIESDIEWGKKLAADVDRQSKFSDDKAMVDRVERIGKALAVIANANHTIATWGDQRMNVFDYTFKVIQDKQINAFSIPGGHIYVYEGLVKYVESDDELAGVLAHEISHAKFRHVATLEHEVNKLSNLTIPLALLAVLTGGAAAAAPALMGGNLLTTAMGNGWSVKAEQAADFGGLQLLEKSQWDPTGMLAFMEQLAFDERYHPELKELGIYRDHPPSLERAESMLQHMREANIPLHRSHVTTSFRATAVTQLDGTVQVLFGKKMICTFGGADAKDRANTAAQRLNDFFDAEPELFDVSVNSDGWIYGRNQPLLKFTDDDAKVMNSSITGLQTVAANNIKKSLYTMGYRIWDGM